MLSASSDRLKPVMRKYYLCQKGACFNNIGAKLNRTCSYILEYMLIYVGIKDNVILTTDHVQG